MTEPRAVAAWSLLVEATTAEIANRFSEAGIKSIILKGPLLTRRLFPEGDDHTSMDVDVLVAPDDWTRAEAELIRVGFEPLLLDIIPGDRPNHARPHVRSTGGPSVDLHRTLLGAQAPTSVVWSTLEAQTQQMRLGEASVAVLNEPGQLMHIALHAAQNGPADARVLRHLERCIELTADGCRVKARSIASAIDATDAFALGLSFIPTGRQLNDRLGVTPHPSVAAALSAASAPNTAHAVEWFATRPSYRDRARFVLHKVFPPKAYMLSSYPRARTQRGFLAAYPARWLWLACQVPPSFRAWREARRASQRSRLSP